MKIDRKISVEKRERTGSGALNQMRKEGWIPGVIYGLKAENTNIKVRAKEFGDLLVPCASARILLDITIGNGARQTVFLKELQYNPLTNKILHLDLQAVTEDSVIKTKIPLELQGEAKGEKIGGQLQQTIHKIAIVAKAKHLPETIVTEVSHLDVNDTHRIAHIDFPEGVTSSLNDDVVVALVAKTRAAQAAQASAE